MDQSVPKPVVVQLDRDDAQPLLTAGLITLTLPTVDRAERQATLSLVCQLSRALRSCSESFRSLRPLIQPTR
jgi:hypothetical protein